MSGVPVNPLPKVAWVFVPARGTSCSAGLPVDFVYDSTTHDAMHAAVVRGPRVGLCGTQPGRSPATCTILEGNGQLCRWCKTQVEKIRGTWRVRAVAPSLNNGFFMHERYEGGMDDD